MTVAAAAVCIVQTPARTREREVQTTYLSRPEGVTTKAKQEQSPCWGLKRPTSRIITLSAQRCTGETSPSDGGRIIDDPQDAQESESRANRRRITLTVVRWRLCLDRSASLIPGGDDKRARRKYPTSPRSDGGELGTRYARERGAMMVSGSSGNSKWISSDA
ncbi:uncharacterized protein BO80DRAFT_188836 [Aspergillus ibericus CBS 121593]|uniref:Uncharacterized protein n=1 Tax=Aspergillus ibericus CBS 121593 TaxID=1448316 RepID=A0A395GQ59_9EURO|nr:hypothetical protein BO80DRAFT_188836 [Aspergillus ibericus CBS 121593]RAK97650.1 hypothetical protein BO80DRAFT_188836 [Aspergillus ibericus CBS 121593]